MILRAFDSLSSGRDRAVDVETVKGKYNAGKHPDVVSGRRTEDEVLFEFLESFDEYCQYLAERAPLDSVTAEDFIEYYNNLYMCVGDEEFAAILNAVWRLGRPSYKRNNREEYEEVQKVPSYEEREEIKYPRVTESSRRGAGNISSIDNPMRLSSRVGRRAGEYEKVIPINETLGRLKKKLIGRGVKGVIALTQELKVTECSTIGL